MTLTLTSSLLKDAAFLADAAYQDKGETASGNLKSSQWTLVDNRTLVNNVQFGLDASYFDRAGFYSAGVFLPSVGVVVPNLAEALVAYNKDTNTLAVSFRGTEVPEDLAADVNQDILNDYYSALTPLMAAVDNFAANIGASVLVTGHSLGGALTEMFMANHPLGLGYENSLAVTFGSIGSASVVNNPGSAPRTVIFLHFGDGNANIGSKNALGNYVIIDLPNVPNQDPIDNLFLDGIHAHAMVQYRNSAYDMANSPLFDSFKSSITSYSVVLDEPDFLAFKPNGSSNPNLTGFVGASFILGLDGADTINGLDGQFNDLIDGGRDNDLINGNGGDDTAVGGAGNDSLNGGPGNDTLYGDVLSLNAQGGSDSLNGGDGNDILYGDAFIMDGTAQGGRDVLTDTTTGSGFDLLIGDAQEMHGSSQGGNDTFRVTIRDSGSSDLYGDAYQLFDNARGGNDILTVEQSGILSVVSGDAAVMNNN